MSSALEFAPVVQMDRTVDSGSAGCAFESRRARASQKGASITMIKSLITVMKENKIKQERNYVDDSLTRRIIAACYEVHNKLGPGFMEKIYLGALKIALQKAEIRYIPEKEFWVKFDDERVGKFRVDLLIENRVIVELKSLEGPFPKVFESQVISYLKASGLRVGLLVNFGNEKCVVRRLVLS
jgi:GxxExxY protein